MERILDAIYAKAGAEADRIMGDSRRKAEEVRQYWEKEADFSREEIFRQAEKQAEEIHRRTLSQAGIESRNIRLSAKQEALEKTFVMAVKKLTQLSAGEKQVLYKNLMGRFAAGRNVRIQLNEKDKAELGQDLRLKDVSVSIDNNSGTFAGGFIMRETGLEINCTFEEMAANSKKAMDAEIAAMLFS